MLKLAPLNKTGYSNLQIDIEDISGGILRLSGNRYRLILAVDSVNFELKSEDEQDALIETYENFINSINFPIQFLIRTREIDMDDYLSGIEQRIASEKEQVFKYQLKSYITFISSLVEANKILSRHFYAIIPYDSQKPDADGAIDQLNLRSDIVTKNLLRLGISARELNAIEIIDLFYSFYSPDSSKSQPVSELALGLMHREFTRRGDK